MRDGVMPGGCRGWKLWRRGRLEIRSALETLVTSSIPSLLAALFARDSAAAALRTCASNSCLASSRSRTTFLKRFSMLSSRAWSMVSLLCSLRSSSSAWRRDRFEDSAESKAAVCRSSRRSSWALSLYEAASLSSS
jgi:hypothetical protein